MTDQENEELTDPELAYVKYKCDKIVYELDIKATTYRMLLESKTENRVIQWNEVLETLQKAKDDSTFKSGLIMSLMDYKEWEFDKFEHLIEEDD